MHYIKIEVVGKNTITTLQTHNCGDPYIIKIDQPHNHTVTDTQMQ